MNVMQRLSRVAGVGLATVLAAALVGCIGIPTSGPVAAGPAANEVEPEYVFTPNGPMPDADPMGILTGFMLAVRAPQADYQVARQFLTPDLAVSWDPGVGVLVRTGAATLMPEVSGSEPVVQYAFVTSASVDGAGRYRETVVAGARTLEFSFQRVDGQWRISAAPNGIVLADGSFERTFRSYALYFFDPSGRYLVPDVRWFPARESTPASVVGSLLAGPDEWLRHSVVSDFPAGTTLGPRSVVVSGGRATVDLSAEVASAPAPQLERMRQQLVASLDVVDATITADGVPIPVESTGSAAIIDPQPAGSVLLGTATAFGHAAPDGIVPIPGISQAVVDEGATAVAVAPAAAWAGFLAADGTVARVEGGAVSVADTREGLVAPSPDEFGWLWSGGGPSPIDAFDPSGTPAGVVASGIPADASIVGLAVSRDSTRLAVALSSPVGPRLLVFGIVRAEGAPPALDPPTELPAAGEITSIAWADDRSLVVVAAVADETVSSIVRVGAPGLELGALPPGAQVVGGRGGVPGVRAIAEGTVFAPGGGEGWTQAGYQADYLGVQQ